MFRFTTSCLVLIVAANALPNPEAKQKPDSITPTIETAARAMGKDCSGGIFSATCLKIGAITMLEKLNVKDELRLLPGVSLVKEVSDSGKAEELAAEIARSLPSKPEERLDKYLLYRLGTFMDTHSVKLRLLDESSAEEARSLVNEARGKDPLSLGGKKGGMGGMMMMGMMMKGYNFVASIPKRG